MRLPCRMAHKELRISDRLIQRCKLLSILVSSILRLHRGKLCRSGTTVDHGNRRVVGRIDLCLLNRVPCLRSLRRQVLRLLPQPHHGILICLQLLYLLLLDTKGLDLVGKLLLRRLVRHSQIVDLFLDLVALLRVLELNRGTFLASAGLQRRALLLKVKTLSLNRLERLLVRETLSVPSLPASGSRQAMLLLREIRQLRADKIGRASCRER